MYFHIYDTSINKGSYNLCMTSPLKYFYGSFHFIVIVKEFNIVFFKIKGIIALEI